MFTKLFAPRRRAPLVSAEALTRFLSENAALVTQKAVIGYCYARTSLPISELMRDQPFVDAFERGRWLSYAAVLEDMFMIAEGRLRAACGDRADQLDAALTARYGAALSEAGSAILDADTRRAAAERLLARLRAAQAAGPASIGDIAFVSGARVYEVMPLHERFRRLDRDSIIASVRFLMVGMASEFDRRIDAPRIVTDLLPSDVAAAPSPA